MTFYNFTPAGENSRLKLVVVGGTHWTDRGQVPLRVHDDDGGIMKSPESPDPNRVDVRFLKAILWLLLLGTLAVGVIGVSIAIHLTLDEGQLISVADRAYPGRE